MEISKTSCLSNIDCVILAGGFGTRLGLPIPKVLAYIDGRHFLSILLEHLKKFGAKRIILSLGYKSHIVEKFLQQNRPSGLTILSCVEPQPMGTAGAIRYVRSLLRSDLTLLMNGDTLVNINFYYFISKHITTGAEASVLCDLNDVSTGIYLFSQTALDRLVSLTGFSLEGILPLIPATNIKMDCNFLDIGTPDDLERAPAFIREMKT